MQTNGSRFTETLDALNLQGAERADTQRNATDIVAAIIAAFGAQADGSLELGRIPNAPITGLVYGAFKAARRGL